jgi:transposase-like protein
MAHSKRQPTFTQEVSLADILDTFSTDARCRTYLEMLRWPEGVHCPRCSGEKIARLVKRNQFECRCGYVFSVTSGTILADSHLPLWKWFAAVYLIGESKKGISSNQLKRMLGVSLKTAWYLTGRIRAAMHDEFPVPLTGTVEADETWIGHGLKQNYRSRPARTPLTTVLGAVERGGEVRVRISDHRYPTKADVHEFINEMVSSDRDALYSDAAGMYTGLDKHASVDHQVSEWVQGDIHSNTIESVWSLFKRSIIGSYHHVSVKHLGEYLDEMAFRYNHREDPFLFRDTLLRLIGSEPLRYAELIAETA